MEHREKCQNMTKNYGASKIKKHQQKGTSFLKISEGRIGMKSTGIVRKVDELGRIVLPIELRRTMNIEVKDALEIYVDGDQIVLKKYEPSCIFCGNAKDIIHYKGKNVCSACAHELGLLRLTVFSPGPGNRVKSPTARIIIW